MWELFIPKSERHKYYSPQIMEGGGGGGGPTWSEMDWRQRLVTCAAIAFIALVFIGVIYAATR